MPVTFQNQTLAQAAFHQVQMRVGTANFDEYLSFARSFATLIHTCGLAQAVAFAFSRSGRQREVLADVATVINAADPTWNIHDGASLDRTARSLPDADDYVRLSRIALRAASWVKRYAEALSLEDLAPNADRGVQP